MVHRLVPASMLDRWNKIAERQGFSLFLISFLLPIFPCDVMNFVAGLSPISPWQFLAASLLGRLPGVALLTLVGSHGLELPLQPGPESRPASLVCSWSGAIAFRSRRTCAEGIEMVEEVRRRKMLRTLKRRDCLALPVGYRT